MANYQKKRVFNMKPYHYIWACIFFAACTNTSSEYFPLGEPISWQYEIQTQTANEQIDARLIISQLAKTKVNGVNYYPFRYASGKTIYYSKNETDIVFAAEPERDTLKLIPHTPELNTSWTSIGHIDLLKSRLMYFSANEAFGSEEIKLENRVTSFNEKINVSAGVFTETMRIDSQATITYKERTQGVDSIQIEESSWYAKGVGLIKKVRTEYSKPEAYRVEQVTELKQYDYL